jgi:hypothetical protein
MSVADDPISDRPEWHSDAACRGTGPAMWCVPRGSGRAPFERLAAQYCAVCPVAGHCLAEAVKVPRETDYGCVRLGVPGNAWRKLRPAVRRWDPTTDADWATLAAWILDDGWRAVVSAVEGVR